MIEITIKQRTDHEIVITVPNENLSGAAAKFMLSDSIDGAPTILATSQSGIDMGDAENGVMVVNLSDDQTNVRGVYYFECEVIGTFGNRSIVTEGIINFKATNSGY